MLTTLDIECLRSSALEHSVSTGVPSQMILGSYQEAFVNLLLFSA